MYPSPRFCAPCITLRTSRESWLRLLTKNSTAGAGSGRSSLSSSERKPMAMCSNFHGLGRATSGVSARTSKTHPVVWVASHRNRIYSHVSVADAVQQISDHLFVFPRRRESVAG